MTLPQINIRTKYPRKIVAKLVVADGLYYILTSADRCADAFIFAPV